MTTFHWTGRDDREDGLLARRIYHAVNANAPRAVIGFASDEGVRRNQGRVGAASGPNAIRKALSSLPIGTGFSGFADLGDVRVQDGDLEGGQERLAETLTGALQTYDRVLVLGGGHETAFGSYLGLRGSRPDARIGIVNFDAHLDIRQIGANGPSSGTPFNQIHSREGDAFDYLCIGVAEEANTQALLERADAWGVHRVMDHELRDNNHKAFEMIDALIMRNDLLYLTID
ncbi:MAG: formimidoylglutamase, partial [Pseudomonadota bacterium]